MAPLVAARGCHVKEHSTVILNICVNSHSILSEFSASFPISKPEFFYLLPWVTLPSNLKGTDDAVFLSSS